MLKFTIKLLSGILAVAAISSVTKTCPAQSETAPRLHGTLIVAVPVDQGLVVCSDKRLTNDQTGKFEDNFIKIRKVNSETLFVATNTIGFLDKSTGKMEFNAFDVVSNFSAKHPFDGTTKFWDALRQEIQKQLRDYLAKRQFAEWPETDIANNRLLFNLIFYSVSHHRPTSYTLRVFYQKSETPVIDIPGVFGEEVRSVQLGGKGKEVVSYFAVHPEFAADPGILRFDPSHFDISKTTPENAAVFAAKLFILTNSALPNAEVSSSHNCVLLDYQKGFLWINDKIVTSPQTETHPVQD